MSKYDTTNTTIPAPAEPLSDAFKAGVKSALPEVITFGRVSHHADTRISDISVAMMRELKMNEDGPAQMSGTMTFLTAESMVAAHALYAEPRTRLFADVENRKITAIFDFLNPNPADAPVTGWGQFKGEISFRDSRKLKEWSKLTDWTGQSDFANFLEDHLEDNLIGDSARTVRAWLLISPRIPPSAVVGHVVPVICCRRENFFPKTFPYYEN